MPTANAPEEDPVRSPEEILDEIELLDQEAVRVLKAIKKLVAR